jgi:hypothetical protein
MRPDVFSQNTYGFISTALTTSNRAKQPEYFTQTILIVPHVMNFQLGVTNDLNYWERQFETHPCH